MVDKKRTFSWWDSWVRKGILLDCGCNLVGVRTVSWPLNLLKGTTSTQTMWRTIQLRIVFPPTWQTHPCPLFPPNPSKILTSLQFSGSMAHVGKPWKGRSPLNWISSEVWPWRTVTNTSEKASFWKASSCRCCCSSCISSQGWLILMSLHKDGSISSGEERITGSTWYLGLLSHV